VDYSEDTQQSRNATWSGGYSSGRSNTNNSTATGVSEASTAPETSESSSLNRKELAELGSDRTTDINVNSHVKHGFIHIPTHVVAPNSQSSSAPTTLATGEDSPVKPGPRKVVQNQFVQEDEPDPSPVPTLTRYRTGEEWLEPVKVELPKQLVERDCTRESWPEPQQAGELPSMLERTCTTERWPELADASTSPKNPGERVVAAENWPEPFQASSIAQAGLNPPFMFPPQAYPHPMFGVPQVYNPNAPEHDQPSFGHKHYFHYETTKTGYCTLGPYGTVRSVWKGGEFDRRLSLVTEGETHTGGEHKYLVQFTGTVSDADGVGFVFSPKLPCPKNIKKICSLFLNKKGRVKRRVFDVMVDCQIFVPNFVEGDWVEMCINLDKSEATFTIWPWDACYWNPMWGKYKVRTSPISYGTWFDTKRDDSEEKVDLNTGHLACVVKSESGVVSIAS